MERDRFVAAAPADARLTPYIDYYYFHESLVDEGMYSFVFYPNTHNALTIYRHSIIEDYGMGSIAVPSAEEFFVCYTSIQSKAFQVHIKRPFNKIGIVFKPLGFNHFIGEKLCAMIPEKHGRSAINGALSERLKPLLRKVYDQANLDQKIKQLDDFFLDQQVPFREEGLKKAVAFIGERQGNIEVNEVAAATGISRRTLGRLFMEHCRCTPIAYIHVVRFRRALKLYMDAANKPRLVDVAMESDFYDQSEFIRHFKKFTGYNPKKELKEILALSQEGTYWKPQ